MLLKSKGRLIVKQNSVRLQIFGHLSQKQATIRLIPPMFTAYCLPIYGLSFLYELMDIYTFAAVIYPLNC